MPPASGGCSSPLTVHAPLHPGTSSLTTAHLCSRGSQRQHWTHRQAYGHLTAALGCSGRKKCPPGVRASLKLLGGRPVLLWRRARPGRPRTLSRAAGQRVARVGATARPWPRTWPRARSCPALRGARSPPFGACSPPLQRHRLGSLLSQRGRWVPATRAQQHTNLTVSTSGWQRGLCLGVVTDQQTSSCCVVMWS